MNYSQIIDISLPLHPGTIVYPGNPQIEIEEIKSQSSGSVLSKITFGSHTGTHIDSQKHVVTGGKPIDSIALETFVGPCRVRILLKTSNSSRGFETFYDDYVFVSPEASRFLAEKEVALVAIDYLSIKQRGSKDNTPHTHLLEKNIPIVEGVDLSKVEPGEYYLIILPLKFVNIDGAPARAVLLK